MGCKYIALLELLTDLEKSEHNQVTQFVGNCIPSEEEQHLEAALANVDLRQISLENQNTILMAPAIEGLEGAIPLFRGSRFASLKAFLNKIGIKVEPSQEESFCLIKQSQLFNLTSLIFFNQDTKIAAPTVAWLLKNLGQRLFQKQELKGGHLAPLGWLNGDSDIVETIKDFLVKYN